MHVSPPRRLTLVDLPFAHFSIRWPNAPRWNKPSDAGGLYHGQTCASKKKAAVAAPLPPNAQASPTLPGTTVCAQQRPHSLSAIDPVGLQQSEIASLDVKTIYSTARLRAAAVAALAGSALPQ
jgi:hypothetical protein